MPKLYLIPSIISPEDIEHQVTEGVTEIIKKVDHFIVENERTARRFIKKVYKEKNIDSVIFFVLNKNTDEKEIPLFLKPVESGHDIGLLSEAGVPCVADPGASVVNFAHQNNIDVIPLVGPSSIMLALMASGLNGQQFCFHGYLPINKNERGKKIKFLERDSLYHKQTQIFMETPYRNNQLLQDILSTCSNHLKLCIAADIFTKNALIKTRTINEWKKQPPDLNKRPVIFLLGI